MGAIRRVGDLRNPRNPRIPRIQRIRRIRRTPSLPRHLRPRRLLAAVGAAGAAVAAVTACEPAGGLNTASVAYTTDQTGTRALEHAGVQVRWLSCTATIPGDGWATANPTHTPRTRPVAVVDCQGESAGGEKITIKGLVTQEIDSRCVRGRLTARVGNRLVFRVSVLGDCSGDQPTANPPRPTVTHTVWPPSRPPTVRPPYTPPVTVTVTASPDPPPPSPDPDPSPSDTCSDDPQGNDGHDDPGQNNGNNGNNNNGNNNDGSNGDGSNNDGNNNDGNNNDHPDPGKTWAAYH
ncbi:hypothetical protein [Streptomyces sp. MST-110588]|uniref:hypothetical protein n=1 Tax=Streptomyces sp. MST-110588 TaxID=2833628 RepID=UPI001F5DF793|nr:hypothetical protein [Streptomyces sp. MST-110588]UNO42059.1 hypothetical protein KGS77_24230 [Streptomyces sp. MST-110588]